MKYDTIIVGAGSAGAVLATRLTEDPKRSVLLLEAGVDYPDFETLPDDLKYGYATGADSMGIQEQHQWYFEAASTPVGRTMRIPRGKVIGGTSAVNGQVFLRPLPEDFDRWVEWGNDAWSFDQVLPYMIKMESDGDYQNELHGSDGPIPVWRHKVEDLIPDQSAFYQACLNAGFPHNADHNRPEATGVGPYPLNNPGGIRYSTAVAYLSLARHRLNLNIQPRSTVRRVIFEGKRAVAVEVERGGERFVVEGDEIILCGGAVASPHLLMLSGIGPADQLREYGIPVLHDSPGVGQNLRDHPTVMVRWSVKPGFELSPQEVGPQKVSLRYTAPGSPYRNDMVMVMISYSQQRSAGMRISLYLAMGKGEMRLQSADPDVQPYINYNYLTDPFDRQRLRDAVHLALRLGKDPVFDGVLETLATPEDTDLASDETLDHWLMRTVHSLQHISCTAKMGPASDPMAVVDQFGLVRGVEGLRVVDGSIMPDCPRANTNLIIMMLGERIADVIKAG